MLLSDKETEQIVSAILTLKRVAILLVIFIVVCLLFQPLLLAGIVAFVAIIYGFLRWSWKS